MGKKSKSLDETMEVAANGEPSTEPTYEDKIKNINVIAKPLAGKKLTKKLYKLIKKACKDKNNFFDGLKLVQLKLRKDEKGLVLLAGDVAPVDTMIHIPGVCEDRDVPYVYLPSQEDIGRAMGVKRSVIMVLVKSAPEYADLYQECLDEIKAIPVPF